uniref:Uncharacterized protein n=1 Tax=Myoviridae sp. ctrnx29 TaxID=2826704 RepID=A0A8S5LYK1_9CAUD|nr:MAG TPA: hypothetical protein [Myoviridae sp. ctrnx29]
MHPFRAGCGPFRHDCRDGPFFFAGSFLQAVPPLMARGGTAQSWLCCCL